MIGSVLHWYKRCAAALVVEGGSANYTAFSGIRGVVSGCCISLFSLLFWLCHTKNVGVSGDSFAFCCAVFFSGYKVIVRLLCKVFGQD